MVRARTEKEKKNIMKKKEPWVKPRHTVVRKLVGAVFAPYVKLKSTSNDSKTFMVASITSLPIPSPGITAILYIFTPLIYFKEFI